MSEESLKTLLSDKIYSRGDLFERTLIVEYSINGGEKKNCKLNMHYPFSDILPSAAEIALELYRQEEVEVTHEAFINAHDSKNVIIRGNLAINIHNAIVDK